MAEQGGQERTEEATPKRLRDARKKGQVARSRDMNTIVILIASFAIIAFLRGYMGRHFRAVMVSSLEFAGRKDLTIEGIFLHSQETFIEYVKIAAPFLVVVAVVALAVGFIQAGPIFSADPMKPQMKRLDAVQNLKNMFKVTTFVELIKNIAKMSLIFLIAYFVVVDSLREVVLTVSAPPENSMLLATQMVAVFLAKVFAVFIVIAIIDVFVQRWQYKKQLRMTKEEVRREYKQDEGDPLIKSHRRHLHQELAMGDVRQAVKSADAVITNPTEVAVAVKYDEAEMLAPQVVAKGQRAFAETIREYAKEASVPILQNPPLAWTLLEVEIGDDIPEELYAAVAEILVYVYRLKEGNAGTA